MPALSLCARLRNERERRQILLSSISANTKISAGLFEALERGDVSRWPSGIFRRSFIRAYAQAIGLDPDAIAREFLEQFPDPLEPPPVTPAAAPPVAATTPASTTGLRLKLADTPTPFVQGRLLAGMRQRWAAVACDSGIILALALCVFIAFNSFWLPLGLAMIAYYLRLKKHSPQEGEYNPLQKMAYTSVFVILTPLVLLSGMAMSPQLNVAFHWLPAMFGGRQSARAIHFVLAFGFLCFTFGHVFMVLTQGFINNMRSMITGRGSSMKLPRQPRAR